MFSQSKKHFKQYQKIALLIEEEEFDQAEIQIEILLDLTKYTWKKPYLLKALIYEKKGKVLESSYEYLKVYDSTNQAHAKHFSRIAESLYKSGYYVEALKYFKISSNLFNDPNKHLRYINNCIFSIKSINNPKEFQPINLGSNINSEKAEYLPNISIDGKKLIITKRDSFSGVLQEDLFFSKNKDGEWLEIQPFPINSPLNEGSATISPDQNLLVYTICGKDDGFGSCDLYVSVRGSNGFWSNPKNLGSSINTRYWESQPFFSPDGKYLYFVSNRRGGYGNDDIWRSRVSIYGFLSPENLGPLINTEYNEMSPFLHQDNLTFYFASEGHIGMGEFDLFVSRRDNSLDQWDLPVNLGYPINSHKEEISLVVSPDGETAFFASDIDGFGKEDIFSFTLPNEVQAKEMTDLEIDIISNKEGSEIILHNVHFEQDSYLLDPVSYKELDIISDYLIINISLKIQIEGHTDNIGGSEYNKILSEKRAQTIYNYLVNERKVNAERLSYVGHGETRPIASNLTLEGRSLNRRTSFIITE